MESDDQDAESMIVINPTPLNDAADVEADLQLCAVNLPVSIPLSVSVVFIHLAMVSDDADL